MEGGPSSLQRIFVPALIMWMMKKELMNVTLRPYPISTVAPPPLHLFTPAPPPLFVTKEVMVDGQQAALLNSLHSVVYFMQLIE